MLMFYQAHYLTKSKENILFELLKRPEITYKKLMELFPEELGDSMFLNQIETDIKYEGYVTRQEQEIIKLKRNEKLKIFLILSMMK